MAAENLSLRSIGDLRRQVDVRFSQNFAKQIKLAGDFADKLTMVMPVKQTGIRLPFINEWQTLEKTELNAAPTYSTVLAKYIELDIAKYTKALEISVYNWTDDSARALFMSQLDAVVAEGAWRRMRAVINALRLGDTDTTYTMYDDELLFSTSHYINDPSVTFSNLLTGTLNSTNIQAGLDVLNTIPMGDDGTYLPMMGAQYYVIYPPQLRRQATLTLNENYYFDPSVNTTGVPVKNPYQNIAISYETNLLQDPNDWYMIAMLPGIKPFCTPRHVSSKDALIPLVSDRDLNVIENDMYRWIYKKVEETHPVHYYQFVKFTNS